MKGAGDGGTGMYSGCSASCQIPKLEPDSPILEVPSGAKGSSQHGGMGQLLVPTQQGLPNPHKAPRYK